MKFDCIELQSSQTEALIAFYARLLGLPCEKTSNGFQFELALGGVVEFVQSNQPWYYHFAINIPENKIDEALEFVKGFAKPIREPETDSEIVDFLSWNAHSLYFFDPAGNIVEFIARHDLKNSSSTPFSGGDLLEISEVGFPCSDVRNTFYFLHESFGVLRYSGNFENFCAAGDEHGLFILTERDRNWFPTEKESIAAPVKVVASNGSRKGVFEFKEGEFVNYTKG